MTKSLKKVTNRNEILVFLKKLLTEKLSGTTCISVTEAEKVLLSILYVLNYGVDGELDNQLSVEECFLLGKQKINKKMVETKLLYTKLVENRLDLAIESYQQTIAGFEFFLRDYDSQYSAHEVTSVWIDYLLAIPVDDQKNRGVDFVYSYIECLYFETNFCQLFSTAQLAELFTIYQEKLKMDYRKDVNNIYERVFFQDDFIEYRKNLFISFYPEKPVFIATDGITSSEFQMILRASVNMTSREKVNFYRQNFQSIYDYFDLFELEELSVEELDGIYHLMSTEELSLLIKVLNREGIEEDKQDLEIAINREKLWQKQFLKYLKARTLAQQNQIVECLGKFKLPFLDFD